MTFPDAYKGITRISKSQTMSICIDMTALLLNFLFSFSATSNLVRILSVMVGEISFFVIMILILSMAIFLIMTTYNLTSGMFIASRDDDWFKKGFYVSLFSIVLYFFGATNTAAAVHSALNLIVAILASVSKIAVLVMTVKGVDRLSEKLHMEYIKEHGKKAVWRVGLALLASGIATGILNITDVPAMAMPIYLAIKVMQSGMSITASLLYLNYLDFAREVLRS